MPCKRVNSNDNREDNLWPVNENIMVFTFISVTHSISIVVLHYCYIIFPPWTIDDWKWNSLLYLGDPSGISLTVTPGRPAYTEGEVVNITCSVLKNYEEADWSWSLPNQNNHNVSNNCRYDESECLHMCSSSIEYTVTRKDAGGPIKCRNGELKNEIKLNLSHSPNLKG